MVRVGTLVLFLTLEEMLFPGAQEDVVSSWLPAHSLVEDVVSGAEIAAAPCLPALAVACLPLCLWGGRALQGSQLALLCYSLSRLRTPGVTVRC